MMHGSGWRRAVPLAVRQWRQHLANRGIARTAEALSSRLLRRVMKSAPAVPCASELWRSADAAPDAPHPFDAEFGTDTSGLIWGEDLPTGHRHDAWNTAYYGIAPSVFAVALEALQKRNNLKWQDYTFVDLGSGKGRAVLLAAQYAFHRVLGVELAPQLHTVALANLARFSAVSAVDGRVTLIQADAAAFPWEQELGGALLFFLYNPFSKPVLARFLGNLKRALRFDCRPVYFLYVNPELDSVLLQCAWVEKIWQETMVIAEADRLADRQDSGVETVAAYRMVAPH